MRGRHPLKPMVEKVYVRRVNMIRDILKAAGEATTEEISAQQDQLSTASISRILASLKADGMIHITDWVNDTRGRCRIALFAWGKGENVPRPGRRKQVYVPRKRRDPLARTDLPLRKETCEAL